MTVLVAIPFYGCADYIEQAVRHVLAQTYRDLVCLVAGDGEMPPLTITDDRLAVVTFPDNRGAPFTQQAMLMGSPFEWYAPHGADDWTDPDYLSNLMAIDGPAKASGAVWWHYPEPVLRHGDHAMVEFGVFDTDLLRSVGGYGADRRCGQDTLLFEDILPHFAPIKWNTIPGYHKRIREGSLTHDPATGFGSPYRAEVVEHNRAVAEQCAGYGWDAERIRAFRAGLVEDRDALTERTDAVRAVLA